VKKIFLNIIHAWNEDNVSRLSAALAYYTIFSLAPLLLIFITIVGLFFGEAASQGRILKQFSGLLGSESARQIQSMVQSLNKPHTGIISGVIGFFILIYAASRLFSELQSGLNLIWKVRNASSGIKEFIKRRFLSFSLVFVIGLLVLVSLLLSSIFTALSSYIGNQFPFGTILVETLNFIISFCFITILFAMIFKILPDVSMQWEEVWLGAMLSAFLFTIGKTLLGIYLGLTHIQSAYGAAGSFIIILIWVYYSAQILFLGAEFSKAHAIQMGKKLE
jgi:membrane protein